VKKKKILFICGFPSGGTDLLKNMLNAHPKINLNGEIPFLVNLATYGYNTKTSFKNLYEIQILKKLLRKHDVWKNIKNIKFDFSDIIKKRDRLSVDEVLFYLFSDNDSTICGNKTPQYTENIDRLEKLSNNFYYIIIVRDVRDICLSMKRKWGRNKYRTAYNWNKRMAKGLNKCEKIDNKRYLFVKYEDLLSNTNLILSRIINFLELEWSHRVLEYEKYIGEITDGKINYGKPLLKDNYEKWKQELKKREVKKIEEIAYYSLSKFEYKIYYANSEKPLKKILLLLYEFGDLLSMIFIGNRSSKKNNILIRLKNLLLPIKKKLKGY